MSEVNAWRCKTELHACSCMNVLTHGVECKRFANSRNPHISDTEHIQAVFHKVWMHEERNKVLSELLMLHQMQLMQILLVCRACIMDGAS